MYATWHDVDFYNKMIKVAEKFDLGFSSKDKEEGSIPIPDSLIALLHFRRLRYAYTRFIFPLPDGKPNGHMLHTLQRLAFRSGLNCGGCYNRAGQCCKNNAMCQHQQQRLTCSTRLKFAVLNFVFTIGQTWGRWKIA